MSSGKGGVLSFHLKLQNLKFSGEMPPPPPWNQPLKSTLITNTVVSSSVISLSNEYLWISNNVNLSFQSFITSLLPQIVLLICQILKKIILYSNWSDSITFKYRVNRSWFSYFTANFSSYLYIYSRRFRLL